MEFKRVVRGYDTEEVDEAISKLEAKNRFLKDFQQTAEMEIDRLKNRLAEDSEELRKYRNDSGKLREAFAGVQRVESQIRENAEREVSGLIEKARNQAEDIIAEAHKEKEAILNESSQMLIRATAEVNQMMEEAQEKSLKIEEESEEMLEKRRKEIQVTLQDLETELLLKQESLNKLTAMEEVYRGKSVELRSHVDAIVNIFSVVKV